METHNPLLKDADGEDVDEHLYRSMIGSLMYLTSSRPDVMFVVCACARFQVNPKNLHLHAVKRIFRYLKGQPKLGLWYPTDSPFDLVAYTDSDYVGASLDRKSTIRAEYISASNCCGQVLWIQNQLLDYGYNFSDVKTASTPMETHKPLLKDAYSEDVDEHLYGSMIGSLMYLTSSRPNIMFADSPFDLVAYTDSDYAGASLDRKSIIGGCQFLGCRLISCQCKKQTVVANSTTEVEYIAASNCCGQVLWIQNQLLDYGYNFMKKKIHIYNKSIICIVKNPLFHSKTKHIEIRHHFIRDSNEKKIIQMIKIHTDQNVTDLLTKAFDVSRFEYLIASIGMLNL
ncbi:hypothetical protein Tco_0956704 [Tanacetum coccineum]